jgi:hypothetical protein
MLALSAGDHAATRFDTMREFAENAVAFTHRGLDHDAQVMIFPAARQLYTTQRLVADAATVLWRAIGDGQVRFTDPHSLQLSTGPFDPVRTAEAYARATAAAVATGYSGRVVTVDMSWALPPVREADELIAGECSAYPLFTSGRLTALCQYPSVGFSPAQIQAACRAHPAQRNGVRVGHEFAENGRLLRLRGETDLTNGTAFAVLVDVLEGGGTIDITGMRFIDVAGLTHLARATQRRARTRIVCTETQARYLEIVGAVRSRLTIAAALMADQL